MTQQEASYEGHHDQIEHSETPGETELPEFTVNDVWSLFDEGYGQEIQAGLIATVTMRHIDEILDEPWVEWRERINPITQVAEKAWIDTEYSRYFQEVERQYRDGGELTRNEFTGLATVRLQIPVGERQEITFTSVPTIRLVSSAASGQSEHELANSVRIISLLTRVPVNDLRQLYIGDYFVLRDEVNRLTPSPSSN